MNYDDLAAAAERGELRTKTGTRVTGAAAAAMGRQLLMEVTGAVTQDEAIQLAVGRPPLGKEKAGPSPQWRVRAPDELYARVEALAEREGTSVSELIRHAVGDYVARRGA